MTEEQKPNNPVIAQIEADKAVSIAWAKYIAMILIALVAFFWAMKGIDGWGWLIFILVLMT